MRWKKREQDEGCYGKYYPGGFTCTSCPVGRRCYALTIKLSLCKGAPIAELATYLTDAEPLIREAAKRRFDELEEINK